MMPLSAALRLPAGQWAKKVKGRKRHIITDTIGLLIGFIIHTADIQDRDGASFVLKSIRYTHPWLRHVFAPIGECTIHLPVNGWRLCRSKTER